MGTVRGEEGRAGAGKGHAGPTRMESPLSDQVELGARRWRLRSDPELQRRWARASGGLLSVSVTCKKILKRVKNNSRALGSVLVG